MRHWTLLNEAPIPGTQKSLSLFKSKDDFHIKLNNGLELMNTRRHGSEDALATLPCAKMKNPDNAHVLVGGLGMGFTLAAALKAVGPNARVTVAELIPEVVEWNRGPLGEYSDFPINDPRTQVKPVDVCELIKDNTATYDVIALDVDNGPEGLTQSSNTWLYTEEGIHAARKALRANGVLSYWSIDDDKPFRQRLRACGLQVEEKHVFAHGNKGSKNTIWLAYVKP